MQILNIKSLVFVALAVWQLFLYSYYKKIRFTDYRMAIFMVGLGSSLNMIIHYGFLPPYQKGQSFFIIEIFRFVLFFMVCYYFISKASRLLPNKRFIMMLLRLIFAITLVVVLVSGIILY